MRVGIGLPAAVPETDMTLIARWATEAERAGFASVGRGALFDASLATMQRTWQAIGDRPNILVSGTVRASFARAATDISDGWVAPLFGLALLKQGGAAVRRAWAEAEREGRPRIMTGRYFCLGAGADETADEYIHHYYGADFFDAARADTLTHAEQIREELRRLSKAGCDDVLLFPCSGDLKQIDLPAQALRATELASDETTHA